MATKQTEFSGDLLLRSYYHQGWDDCAAGRPNLYAPAEALAKAPKKVEAYLRGRKDCEAAGYRARG